VSVTLSNVTSQRHLVVGGWFIESHQPRVNRRLSTLILPTWNFCRAAEILDARLWQHNAGGTSNRDSPGLTRGSRMFSEMHSVKRHFAAQAVNRVRRESTGSCLKLTNKPSSRRLQTIFKPTSSQTTATDTCFQSFTTCCQICTRSHHPVSSLFGTSSSVVRIRPRCQRNSRRVSMEENKKREGNNRHRWINRLHFSKVDIADLPFPEGEQLVFEGSFASPYIAVDVRQQKA